MRFPSAENTGHMNSRSRLLNVRTIAGFALLLCLAPLPSSSQESAPKPLKKVIPEYPEVLKRMGVSGIVRLRVTIGPDGSIKEIEVRGGSAIFTESVSKAVKQWRYPPSDKARVADVSVEFDCCATVITTP
jgi:TonB family protein